MNKYIYIFFIVIISYLLLKVYFLNNSINSLKGEKAELEENLKTKTVIYKDKIIYKYRDKDNSPKQTEIYIPDAGSVEIVEPIDNSSSVNLSSNIIETDSGYIKVKNKGVTINPNLQVGYYEELSVAFGLELFYWNRYGLGISISSNKTLSLYASRSISDFISEFKNTFVNLGYGVNFDDSDSKLSIGFGVYL